MASQERNPEMASQERRSQQRLLAEKIRNQLRDPLFKRLISAAHLYIASLSMDEIIKIREDVKANKIQGPTLREIADEESLERGEILSQLKIDDKTDLPLYNEKDKDIKRYIGLIKDRARLTGGKIMVLFADCDDLGQVNKLEGGGGRGGHRIGDRYIRTAAEILNEGRVAGMRVFRYGKKADEFLILGFVEDIQQAISLAVRLGNNAAQNLARRTGLRVIKSASITMGGVLVSPDSDIFRTVRESDDIMRDAKNEGKNRLILTDQEGNFVTREFESKKLNNGKLNL
jgi:diguanylate cyclase (GGDEF)-like protein